MCWCAWTGTPPQTSALLPGEFLRSSRIQPLIQQGHLATGLCQAAPSLLDGVWRRPRLQEAQQCTCRLHAGVPDACRLQ